MTIQTVTPAETGAVIVVPLNKLKKSQKNARKTPHKPSDIEAMAASVAVKGVLQPPVVEPEIGADGEPTGFYLVTIGEGRRQALGLLAKRKAIRKTHPVRCVLDTANDPFEISLDENVTRADMHPADQLEAFKRLADERGLSAEEIGARFGVSAAVVRQRLRLGAVSPKLLQLYREEALSLDQLMAFGVSEDHVRQEQVYEQLSWNRTPPHIRRAMTEAKVPASDRRALFVAVEAYAEAGGTMLRDLFSEDGGGWLEDVGLLDRLVGEKLETVAAVVREREGWKWVEVQIDFPHGLGLSRVYPHPVERSEEEQARMAALAEEYDALVSQWDAVEELPPEIDARFREIDAALEAFGDGSAYADEDRARGGVFVVLGHDGLARIERGLIRPEDEAPEPEIGSASDEPSSGDTDGDEDDDRPIDNGEDTEPDGDASAPLPDRIVADLTAHRTMALRNAMASDQTVAVAAVVHSLVLAAFYPPYERASCLEIRCGFTALEPHAPGIADSEAGRCIAERHETWAVRLPQSAGEVWAFVQSLGADDLLNLLAHCAGLTINAVRSPADRRPGALGQADALAEALDLDMTTYWSPTARSYLGRVTKAKIGEAVTDAVSPEAAERIAGLKKTDMAEAAETLLAGTGWLPSPLRRAGDTVKAPASAGTLGEAEDAAIAA
ncbi:MAG: chromosome partitioning protein ParB [Caulobacterales bacterium 32-69-10]|nr:MAG: chromosome partitioning protein ParB [Caulobacterales bacterium 32-69-10]